MSARVSSTHLGEGTRSQIGISGRERVTWSVWHVIVNPNFVNGGNCEGDRRRCIDRMQIAIDEIVRNHQDQIFTEFVKPGSEASGEKLCDYLDDCIKDIRIVTAFETGSKFHRLHMHVSLKVLHKGKIHLRYKEFLDLLRRKLVTGDGAFSGIWARFVFHRQASTLDEYITKSFDEQDSLRLPGIPGLRGFGQDSQAAVSDNMYSRECFCPQ
jgi:hypothetical protein